MELPVQLRTIKKSENNRLRRQGWVPAVIYGHGIETRNVAVAEDGLSHVLLESKGRSSIITLKLAANGASEEIPVLIKQVQRHPTRSDILHVDFYRLIMEEQIKARVPVVLHGEPYGVKREGGILVQALREIEVKCLPANIPPKFEVDISSLKIGDAIHVSDIPLPADVTWLMGGGEIVVKIVPPAKEEEAPTPIVSAAEVPSEKGAPKPEGEVAAVPETKKPEKAPEKAEAKESKEVKKEK